jgi:hypothetical protein
MAVKVTRFSRLRFGRLAQVDGIEFWDVLDLPTIPEQLDDIVHAITDADRIDLLAHKYYRDSRLWWVIAVANDMEDIPTEFNVGDEIRIPAPRYVTQVLFNKAAIQARA